MKKIRNHKTLAFGLAVLLFMLQITSSAAIWQTEEGKGGYRTAGYLDNCCIRSGSDS